MYYYIHVLFVLFLSIGFSVCLQISGSVDSNEHGPVFKYLNKFGASKDKNIYMYGRVNSDDISTDTAYSNAALVFVPSSIWNEVDQHLNDKTLHDSVWCNSTLTGTLNAVCITDHRQYYHTVPCVGHCDMKPLPGLLDAQIYFSVISNMTEYWYAFFLFCAHNTSTTVECNWKRSNKIHLNYTLYIVNGDPREPYNNIFSYQFPANHTGLLLTYMIFTALYLFLLPFHVLVNAKGIYRCKVPFLIWLFSLAVIFENINIVCGLIHFAVYATNGIGIPYLNNLKEIINLVGDWLLILVLVLVAGGWMVTVRTIKWKYISFPIIGIYILLSIVYFIWSMVYPYAINPIDTINPLQTWAGALYLAARSLTLFYVWYQIYHIHRQEEVLQKLRLYRVLFVIFTVWFWYLPLFVFIASVINPVYTDVVLINVMNSMNFMVNLVMVALLCPIWSHEYFMFDHVMNQKSIVMKSLLKGSSFSENTDNFYNEL